MPAKQNFLLQSEDLTSVSWVKQANVVPTANQAIAPDGTLTADLVDVSAAAGGTGFYQLTTYSGPIITTLSRSIWLKGVAGGEVITIQDAAYSVTPLTCVLTTEWKRFTITTPSSGLSTSCGFWLMKVSGNQFYAWGMQLVNANWAGDYAKTTTSIINTGRPRDIVLKQNLLAYSENFLNAFYTTYFTTPVTTTDTLDPQKNNGAHKLSETVNVDYHYFYQAGAAMVMPNGVYTSSVYMKAGTSRYVSIYNGQLAGAVASFDLVLGTVTYTVGTQFLSADIKPLANGWFRCSLTATNFEKVGIFMNTTSGTLPSPHVGDTSRNIYMFGYQLVKANHAGDYQPTVGVAINNPIRNAVLKQNLLRSSDFTNVLITKVGTPTITGGQLAPDGTLTAYNVSSVNATTYLQQQVGRSLIIGKTYTQSIWMKADANCNVGFEFIDIGDGNPAYAITAAVTTTWKQFSITTPLGSTALGAAMGLIVGSRFAAWDTARTVTMWHPQIVESNWVGDDCPTSGAIVDNPIRNAVLKQNLIIYSNQMENWTKTAGCTRTAVVEDGRTCSRLDFATIGDYIYRNSTTPIEVGPHGTRLIPSFWIKKISSSGTISMFNPISFSYGRFIIDLALLPSGWVKIDYAKPAPWMTVTHTYGVYLTRNDGMAFQPVDIGLSVFVADNQIVANANHGGEYQPTGATAITNPIRDIVLKQNLLIKSSDFASADWTKRGTCVVTPDQAISPLTGLMTASLITGMAGVGHDMYNTNYATTIAPPANSVVTPSLYIKRISTVGSLQIQNPTSSNLGWWRIDFAALQDNVWYRVGKDTPGFTEVFPFLSAPAVGMLLNSTASGFSFYLDGAQVVKANHAGDYQPTTGTAVGNPIRLSA